MKPTSKYLKNQALPMEVERTADIDGINSRERSFEFRMAQRACPRLEIEGRPLVGAVQ